MAKKTERVGVGTGDVFMDLGFAVADERKLRTQLAPGSAMAVTCARAPR